MKNTGIRSQLASGRHLISVEFFPPKDEAGGELIVETARRVRDELSPDFVSITYGAGGTTRERTLRYARILKGEYGFEVMPHLTCVGAGREEIEGILAGYAADGFANIMALRGDPPKGQTVFEAHPDGLPYAADLVALIRARYPEVSIGVAGYPEVHPEAISAAKDLEYLKAKVDCGADFITTQLFYDNSSYERFAESCARAGITVPILPGLMPIRSAVQARRFCKRIPAELDRQLSLAGDDKAALRTVGIDWTIRQIDGLLDSGAPGVHLYIMNRPGMAVEIFQALRGKFGR